MNGIKVSVIVPVYNSEKYLEKCVDSILEQDFDGFELLLIDDGSTDKSGEICDAYEKKDKRVRVFHLANSGICKARNFGLSQAYGDYIAFSDHDDYVMPGFLKDNYEYAKSHDADIVKFGRDTYYLHGDDVFKKNYRRFEKRVIKGSAIKNEFLSLRLRDSMSCVWDSFIRNEFLKANGLCFNPIYTKGGEDIDFSSNCYASANVIAFNDKAYYVHYIRYGYSTSTKPDNNKLEKLTHLHENLNECMKLLHISPEDCPESYILIYTKEYVYSALSYYYGTNKRKEDIISFLDGARKPVEKLYYSSIKMMKYSFKWTLLSIMYMKKYYHLLHLLLKIKKR